MTTAPDQAPPHEAAAGASIFAGAGEMAAMCTSHEWSGTAIGCPVDVRDRWDPPTLDDFARRSSRTSA